MSTFFELLWVEIKIVLSNVKDSLINNAVFCGLVSLVSGYILKAFGTSDQLVSLQASSLIVSSIGFEVYRSIFRLLSDIEGDRYIQYYFTLPISNSLIFLQMISSFVVNGLIFAFSALIVLRIMLPHIIVLSDINYFMFTLTVIILGGFFGVFSLFLTAYTKSMMKVSNTLMRVLFPIWIIGGFQFSYSVARSISPFLGYLTLLSPYTYANEAMRSVLLGPSGFLNIYISFSVLGLMGLAMWALAIRKLRKKLDFI